MKKILAVMVTSLGFSFAVLVLSSCTFSFHGTKDVVKNLQPEVLYESFNTKPTNLKTLSKCLLPPTINIVNVEAREDEYLYHEQGAAKFYINPKEFMNGTIDYLRDGYEKSGVKVDNNSPKLIQVSMQHLRGLPGFACFGGNLRLKIYIPETKYAKDYEAEDLCGGKNIYIAPAYAVHLVTQKILTDPVIQDYILCR